MSRLDWFLGREGLKKNIVRLEDELKSVKDKLQLREHQIVSASKIVIKYKTQLSNKELENSTLQLENRLLRKIPK